MNLSDKHIRSLLAPLYHEACFDPEIDMIQLAELLEYLARTFKEENPHEVWRKLKLDKSKYDTPSYNTYLLKLEEQYDTLLGTSIVDSIRKTITESSLDEAYDLWFEHFVEALAHWNNNICDRLCSESFGFSGKLLQKVQKFKKLNDNINNAHWVATIKDYLSLAENKSLPEKSRSYFYICIGQIELYHILPNHDEAFRYFDLAMELYPGDNVYRAYGEYHLRVGEYEKAKESFLMAVEMDPNDLNNYLYMGDCYREENKYDVAEQWYDDALHINFYDVSAYLRKLMLSGHARLIDAKTEKTQSLISTVENNHDTTELYATYRDIGYSFSIPLALNDSLAYYEKATTLKPHLSPAHIDKGYIYTQLEKYDEALIEFEKAKEIIPDSFDIYWGLAYVYEMIQDWDRTIESYLKCLELRPSQTELVHYNLGFFYEKNENFPDAKKQYQLALDSDPNNKKYFESLKSILEEHGDPDELHQLLVQDIDRSPNDPLAYNELGVFYSKMKNSEKAIKCYLKSIELNPDEPVYYENIGLAYEDIQDYVQAEKMYLKAIDAEKTDGIYHNRMGYFLSTRGENDKAIPFYKEAVNRNPDSQLYITNLGIGYNNANKRKEAINLFKKVLEKDPDNILANSEMGIALLYLDDNRGAEKYLQKAIDLEPENTVNYENLGYLYQKNLEYEKSIKVFEKGLQVDPTNHSLNNRVGVVKYCLNDLPTAIKYYEKAIKVSPNMPIYYDNLGLAYEDLNDSEAATIAYTKSQQLKEELGEI